VGPVPGLPSFYEAETAHINYVVGQSRPWTVAEQTFEGRLIRNFWIPSDSRPKIVYVMPHALALLVAKPAPAELLLNTSSGHLARLWRLPQAMSLYPASMGGYGSHTFFFAATAGVQGPLAAYGAYDVAHNRRLQLNLAAVQGSWFDDLTRGVIFRLKDSQLSQWQNGRWVVQGEVPQGPVQAVSQQSWIMTVTPERRQILALRWLNVKSGVSTTEHVAGILEASGADWALVLRHGTLVLAIPSKKSQRVLATHVFSPLTANDAVYWTTPEGGVDRAVVSSQAISAVPNIMWP
jgi:hypothetical protein